jgi:N-methylhydantoinase A/oxoprolinase/acetone carboxylase beta subunit
LKTYNSGPRGGAEGLKAAAAHYGFRQMLMLDVGGTSTDFAEVIGGEVRTLPHGEVEGIECSYPACDIVSIGAGGGSIFRARDGEVTVGPDSVGGAPGPASFGMGGKEATITDALLVMGLLDPATYFGGEMKLDRDRALAVIKDNVADPLGLSPAAAVQKMIEAFAAKVAIGIDDFTQVEDDTVLMGFGGGGPMNALSCAEAAGIKRVLIPRLAAVYSAFGIGFSDINNQYQRELQENTQAGLEAAFSGLRERASRDMFSEGFELDECRVEVSLLQGDQSYALDAESLALPADLPSRLDGHDGPATLVLKAVKVIKHAHLQTADDISVSDAVVGAKRVLSLPEGEITVPVYNVRDQIVGAAGQGPCVIEEDFFTCRILPGWTFEFTDNRDILLTQSK